MKQKKKKRTNKDKELIDEYDSPWKEVIQQYFEDASKVGTLFLSLCS